MTKRIVRWLCRLAVGGVVALILLATAAAVWQAVATRNFERRHPAPGRLVDVGGHRLHFLVRGEGSPTVVIDAGLSGASSDWEKVADGVATFTRVCTYDRAGYGWSDVGPRPRTSQQVVEELRVLLNKAGLKPPYLLLGHSWGGLNLRLYASLHPEEVAGLILVDALNTDLHPVSAQPGAVPALYTLLNYTAFLGPQRWVTPGIIREPVDDPPAREFRLAMLNRTKSTRTIYDELTGQANWLQVRAALRHLGDLPVTVMTTQLDSARATNGTWVGGLDWLKAQYALTNLSHRSRLMVADTTEHDIQFHRPDQIVSAVREMVEQLPAARPVESVE
jgi:pimeloyl-ACP methyl ester carboxylesterase